MKISNWVIVFLCIVLLIGVTTAQNVQEQTKITSVRTEYNNALDSAIDAALEGIVESADGTEVAINRDECVTNFYQSLYSSFGAISSETAQTQLRVCVPVLAIVDIDGLYVYHSSTNGNKVTSNWSEKIPYVYSAPGYTIVFELGTQVKLKVVGDNTVYSGDYRHLREQYEGACSAEQYEQMCSVWEESCLSSAETFEGTRARVITDTIVSQLNYYVQMHNEVGRAYGFDYTFALPENAAASVARAIGDVSFVSFFQGYPYGVGTENSFSKFTVSGARIEKNKKYFVNQIDGVLYYHTVECELGLDSTNVYDSREECARTGASPCPYCNP